jgi:uncharacterized protein HemX
MRRNGGRAALSGGLGLVFAAVFFPAFTVWGIVWTHGERGLVLSLLVTFVVLYLGTALWGWLNQAPSQTASRSDVRAARREDRRRDEQMWEAMP